MTFSFLIEQSEQEMRKGKLELQVGENGIILSARRTIIPGVVVTRDLAGVYTVPFLKPSHHILSWCPSQLELSRRSFLLWRDRPLTGEVMRRAEAEVGVVKDVEIVAGVARAAIISSKMCLRRTRNKTTMLHTQKRLEKLRSLHRVQRMQCHSIVHEGVIEEAIGIILIGTVTTTSGAGVAGEEDEETLVVQTMKERSSQRPKAGMGEGMSFRTL